MAGWLLVRLLHYYSFVYAVNKAVYQCTTMWAMRATSMYRFNTIFVLLLSIILLQLNYWWQGYVHKFVHPFATSVCPCDSDKNKTQSMANFISVLFKIDMMKWKISILTHQWSFINNNVFMKDMYASSFFSYVGENMRKNAEEEGIFDCFLSSIGDNVSR